MVHGCIVLLPFAFRIIVDIQGEASGSLFGSKYHYKMTATNVPSVQNDSKKYGPVL